VASTRLSDQVGRVVSGRYRLVAPLGTGASAQVFLADDVRLERQVAIKMLQPALADDERFLRRFRAEARTVAAISHPNVVVVHDWGDDDVPYLVTEYLAGGSLRAILHAGRRLTPAQALVVGLDVCRGLAHAHGLGLVHRDLKPANVLFDTDGRLRIADFGLARAIAEASVTEPDGAMVGTARYVAPEQARGERLDGKADVYALGLVLVEAVTGTVPFASDTTIGTLMGRIERDLEVPEALGPLRSVVERAGRLRPDERPDAEELGILLLAASERLDAPPALPLVGALEEARSGADTDELARTDMVPLPLDAPAAPIVPPPAATSPVPGRTDESAAADGPGRRRRWLLVLVALLLVALGAGAFFAVDAVRTPTYEIPDVAGQQLADLELVAAQNQWELDEKRTRLDGTEPGEIVSTDPPPGEQLEESATLVVVVSEGNTLTDRPAELKGRPLAEAVVELERAGLEHQVVREVFDERIPEGSVVGLAEDVPDVLPRGEVVPLVVSLGPAPRTVPDVADGATYDAVAAELEALQLVPVRAEAFSDTVPAGAVISLSEPAGTEVPRDSQITVTVSKGPDLVGVPDLRGMTLAEAESALQGAGLQRGQDCCNSNGRVAFTDPPPGAQVRRGTSVDLFLTR
jgi:beta-lactam-binding protein with PASTA domain/tRNA A-37 threonylcarbamoyl transferase component Bud32